METFEILYFTKMAVFFVQCPVNMHVIISSLFFLMATTVMDATECSLSIY